MFELNIFIIACLITKIVIFRGNVNYIYIYLLYVKE